MTEKELGNYIAQNFGEEALRQYCRYIAGAGSLYEFMRTMELYKMFPECSPEELERIVDAINEVHT